MKKIVTPEGVEGAMGQLTAEGKELTPKNIREIIGGGSYTPIISFRDAILSKQAPPPADAEQERKAFDTVWSTAIAKGRAERDAELTEANHTIADLVAEIERVETETTFIANRVERVEKQRDETMAQISAANAATVQARAAGEQYAGKLSKALSRIASMQEAHAKVMEQLRGRLDEAETKSHALELALARAETKLDERSLPSVAAAKFGS